MTSDKANRSDLAFKSRSFFNASCKQTMTGRKIKWLSSGAGAKVPNCQHALYKANKICTRQFGWCPWSTSSQSTWKQFQTQSEVNGIQHHKILFARSRQICQHRCFHRHFHCQSKQDCLRTMAIDNEFVIPNWCKLSYMNRQMDRSNGPAVVQIHGKKEQFTGSQYSRAPSRWSAFASFQPLAKHQDIKESKVFDKGDWSLK